MIKNKEAHSARPFSPDIYFQTTEFTCGPATLMMAMAALDPQYKPGRLDEATGLVKRFTVF